MILFRTTFSSLFIYLLLTYAVWNVLLVRIYSKFYDRMKIIMLYAQIMVYWALNSVIFKKVRKRWVIFWPDMIGEYRFNVM
jgi:hypothetical protein